MNLTVTRQLLPAAKLAVQLLLARLKSPAFAPVSEMLVIPKAAGPVFVNVTCWLALFVPTTCGANVSDVVLRLTWVPLPLSVTVGLGFTLALVTIVDRRRPRACGRWP